MTNARPIARDDLLIFFDNDFIRGNIISDDVDPEGAQLYLRFFDGVRVGAKQGPAQETIVEGDYGTFTVRPDGSFTYELDRSLDVVKKLEPGQQLVERVTYKISDGAGGTDVGQMILGIDPFDETATYNDVFDFDDIGVLDRVDDYYLPDYRGFALTVNGSSEFTLINAIANYSPGIDAITEDGFSDTVLFADKGPVTLKTIDGDVFTFRGASIAEWSAEPFTLKLTGRNDGQIVYQQEIDMTDPELVVDIENVDQIDFDFLGASVVMDNIAITALIA